MKTLSENFNLLEVKEFNTVDNKIVQVACYFTLYNENVGFVVSVSDEFTVQTIDCSKDTIHTFKALIVKHWHEIKSEISNFLNQPNDELFGYTKATIATENAKKILKIGDRIRVLPCKCHAKKVTITFNGFDGDTQWILSKSGGCEYHALYIDRLNGKPINFLD